MGTRWEGVLVQATEDQIQRLPSGILAFADTLVPAIRVTLSAFEAATDVWALELAGINKNPLRLAEPARLDHATPREALAHVGRCAEVQLAMLVSRLLGRSAIWVYHSDGACASGSGVAKGGTFPSLEWTEGTGNQYPAAARRAIQGVIPELLEVEELLEVIYDRRSKRVAWRLKDRHALLPEPVCLVDSQGRADSPDRLTNR